MKRIIHTIFVAIVLFNFSCNQEKTSSYSLISSEYYFFDSVENSRYHRFHNSFRQNGKDWIVSLASTNAPSNTEGSYLIYYCRDSNNSVQWHCSHTQKFPEFNGHYVLPMDIFTNNADSAFVLPYGSYEVKVVYADTCRGSYTCYLDTTQANESIHRNQINIENNVFSWIFYNDALYTSVYHDDLRANTFAKLMEKNFELPLYGKFVNKGGMFELEKTFGRYPEIYKTNFFGGLGDPVNLVTDSNYLYATFRHDHNVYIYDDTVLIAKKPMRSPNVKNLKGMGYGSNPTEMATYWVTNDRYGRFYYDPYRQLFYRQAMYPSPEYLKENLKMRQKLQNWDLLIFDKEFNLVGKHYFVGDMYLSHIAVLPEGLLIQCYGNENIEMQLFKVDKK